MNKYLSLQAGTNTQDTDGEATTAYTHYAYVWGSLEPLSGAELESARQISEAISYSAIIRYNSSVKSEDRVVWNSRTFEIQSILNNFENNKMMTLMLKEVK